jgi:ABC-type phosphate transport system substrate-binding protein
MSGHRSRPGAQPRHLPHTTLKATAATITVLALGACSATTTATIASTASPAPATAGASAATLTGAGSTFDAPFFSLAFARYHQQHPAATISYSAAGRSRQGSTRPASVGP